MENFEVVRKESVDYGKLVVYRERVGELGWMVYTIFHHAKGTTHSCTYVPDMAGKWKINE